MNSNRNPFQSNTDSSITEDNHDQSSALRSNLKPSEIENIQTALDEYFIYNPQIHEGISYFRSKIKENAFDAAEEWASEHSESETLTLEIAHTIVKDAAKFYENLLAVSPYLIGSLIPLGATPIKSSTQIPEDRNKWLPYLIFSVILLIGIIAVLILISSRRRR